MNGKLRIFLIACHGIITTASATLVAPSELKVWPVSDTEIQLQWKDLSNEELGFKIQRATSRNGTWEDIPGELSPDTQSYTDSGLQPDTLYFYRIGAHGTTSTLFGAPAKTWTDDHPFGNRTISFQNGYGFYQGTLSNGIDQTNPLSSLAGAILWVDNNNPADQRQVLLDFRDIFGSAPDQLAPAATILSAKLRIYLSNASNVESRKPIDIHRMLVSWQSGVSWSSSSLGSDGIQTDGIEAVIEPDSSNYFSVPGQYFEADVTIPLQSWASGNNQHGLALLTNWSDGFGFHTELQSIYDHRPELIVTYDSDPQNAAPDFSQSFDPKNEAVSIPDPAIIKTGISDPDGPELSVSLFGRQSAIADEDFKVILLPDTQFYSGEINGGTRHIFFSQTDWIVNSRESLNIAFVLHMGDISQSGDIKNAVANSLEWSIAAQAMYRLHNPSATGLAEGIPYAVSVGNHDQEPMWRPSGTTDFFNQYFGENHFAAYSYYGGHYGDNNDNYYSLFQSGSHKFIVISMEYWDPARDPIEPDLLLWADDLLKQYSDRIGIVVSHHMVNPGNPASWSPYGETLYEVLKDNPNLKLMLGGHVTGEGLRVNEFEGNTIYALVQDYQSMEEGGSGFLRILNFSPERNELDLSTYSPWLDRETSEFGGSFTLPFPLGTVINPFEEIASLDNLTSPSTISLTWPGLLENTKYEWYMEASDGRKYSRTPLQSFTSASSTYTSWRNLFFTENDSDGDRWNDPDGDKISNLEEYLFTGDPLVPGTTMIQLLPSESGFVLTYHRRTGTGLYWIYEYSNDLNSWHPIPAEELPPALIDILDGNTESVQVQLNWTDLSERRFWRINPTWPD